jgi:hypothetical protein
VSEPCFATFGGCDSATRAAVSRLGTRPDPVPKPTGIERNRGQFRRRLPELKPADVQGFLGERVDKCSSFGSVRSRVRISAPRLAKACKRNPSPNAGDRAAPESSAWLYRCLGAGPGPPPEPCELDLGSQPTHAAPPESRPAGSPSVAVTLACDIALPRRRRWPRTSHCDARDERARSPSSSCVRTKVSSRRRLKRDRPRA